LISVELCQKSAYHKALSAWLIEIKSGADEIITHFTNRLQAQMPVRENCGLRILCPCQDQHIALRAVPDHQVWIRLCRARYHGGMRNTDHKLRCPWCLDSDAYAAYNDQEWAAEPVHDERMLLELLILECAR
jgi:hypothetical protein